MMIVELRIYHCVPGRLPDLHKRIETGAMPIWARHGIKPIGFWTTLVGPTNQALTYMLQWESLADRERRWTAFMNDPEWQAKRAQSEANGQIVERIDSSFLVPTAYSPIK
jgi:NIPSNAP